MAAGVVSGLEPLCWVYALPICRVQLAAIAAEPHGRPGARCIGAAVAAGAMYHGVHSLLFLYHECHQHGSMSDSAFACRCLQQQDAASASSRASPVGDDSIRVCAVTVAVAGVAVTVAVAGVAKF